MELATGYNDGDRTGGTLMPRTTKQKLPTKAETPVPTAAVLTLPEVAAYLRLPEAKIERLVRESNLPGRWTAEEWRFLKVAVDDWLAGLSVRSSKEAQMAVAGVWKDHPTIPEMLKEIYRQRGRPTTEDG
jgi:excisionase family DNA binding protein